MGVHLVALDGNIDDLDVCRVVVPLLAHAAGLTHELADYLVHDFDVLGVGLSLPVSITVFGVAFPRTRLLRALALCAVVARCSLLEGEDLLVRHRRVELLRLLLEEIGCGFLLDLLAFGAGRYRFRGHVAVGAPTE